MYTSINIYIYMRVCVRIYTDMNRCMHMYLCVCTNVCVYIYIDRERGTERVYIYIYISTHESVLLLQGVEDFRPTPGGQLMTKAVETRATHGSAEWKTQKLCLLNHEPMV